MFSKIDTSSITSVEKFLKNNFADIVVLNSGGPPPMKFNDIKINDWKNILINYLLIFNIKKLKDKKKWIYFLSSSIIKEPGNSLIISSSLRLQ